MNFSSFDTNESKAMMKRRITIHSTKSRIVTIRGASKEFTTWCKECGKVVRMLPPEEVAAIAQVSSRAIYRAIEAGELHFVELPTLFICCDSLQALLNNADELPDNIKPIP